jgi:hypothetical protein
MRLTILPALFLALPAFAQERIPSHCHAMARGPETIMRASLGAPVEADHVRIRYIDHASFVIETPGGLTVVTDYNGFTGGRDWVPDVVTMNNAHHTHWIAAPDPRIPHVLEGWAEGDVPKAHELDLGEILIRNVHTDVRSRFGDGARKNGNSIFVFEVAGLCIGHLGHLHHPPDEAQFAAVVFGRLAGSVPERYEGRFRGGGNRLAGFAAFASGFAGAAHDHGAGPGIPELTKPFGQGMRPARSGPC